MFYFGIKHTFLLFVLDHLSPKDLNFELSNLGVLLLIVCYIGEFILYCFKLYFNHSFSVFISFRLCCLSIACRYVHRELLAKNAIDPQNLPTFFNAWIDRSHKLCIYTVAQTRAWPYNILRSCPWFLDCPIGFFSSSEEEEFKGIDKVPDVEDIPVESQVISSQTGKRKHKGKISSTPTQPPTNTPTTATGLPNTPLDLETSIFSPPSSQQVPNAIRQDFDSAVKVMLENTSIFNMFNTTSHPLLMKTHDFVKQVSIWPSFVIFFLLAHMKFEVGMIFILIYSCRV